MNLIRKFSPLAVLLLCTAVPALAGTVVASPANGAQVSSPFTLTMSADTCSSLPVTEVGFSFDNSTSTQGFAGQQMNGPVNAPVGPHILHVKVWNEKGGVCVTDLAITVGGGAAFSAIVPSYAPSVSQIQVVGNWFQVHDGGTPGSSYGAMSVVNSPSLTGTARMFSTSFSYYGGQRYSAQFADDTQSTNFFYDTWVYVVGNSNGFSNLEFDLNQTMSNGETVVMGFQCDSWIGKWDYAVNAGSPTQYNDTWGHSAANCNARSWAPNQWHHVQIWFSHDTSGWVTYHAVWLDGAQQDLNIRAFSGYMLGWGPAVVTNFQIDGASPGTTSAQVALDHMIVYRW
ncbi:hypothetical protein DYQ86_11225 [Acidobacteria bacterium AB60]|nr:hypothetical protein DYQ86_11225 [Acidobacteria bacterium AB60]